MDGTGKGEHTIQNSSGLAVLEFFDELLSLSFLHAFSEP
jgi:hypothetical protein